MIVEKYGLDVLRDPDLNKGTGFSLEERRKFRLEGLLPPGVRTQEVQLSRALSILRRKSTALEKYIYLFGLQARNRQLFYRLVMENLVEVMPIIYTPTVGKACKQYGNVFRTPMGFYISTQDKSHIREYLSRWPHKNVRVIVVTDGERILGLGDLGANGMGIPVGKLSLYVACAGVHPTECLPVMIDVGTDNGELIKSPTYLGLRQPRVKGADYDELIDEFVSAVQSRFPDALIQFEDFVTENAIRLLRNYREKILCFNDDIQGTAAVALAGVYAATRITQVDFNELRFLFLGAGSAAIGIGDLIVFALMRQGLKHDEAVRRIWFVDSKGLIVRGRSEVKDHARRYAHDHSECNFLEAIDAIKPHVLIGATGHPQTFTQAAIHKMCTYNERPIVFALSNPTSRAECTAAQAYEWSAGKAVFASGSPFKPVHHDGQLHVPGQGNNVYIFPGIGLAAKLAKISRITEEMFLIAAQTAADAVKPEDLKHGTIYPPLNEIRAVTEKIAHAVAEYAWQNQLAKTLKPDSISQLIRDNEYSPYY